MAGGDGGAGPGAGLGRRWDVALSFAGAQRAYVERVAAALKARGVRCFYDADEQVRLWGTHLAEELPRIYARETAVVVVFVSAEYAGGDWTRLERRAAFSRAVAEAGVYVLPARFDDSELPGLLDDVVSVDLRGHTPERFADLVAAKLGGLAGGPGGGPQARAGAGWPLGEVRDPFALEVHRPVQPEGAAPGLPDLPAYVPREHDTELGRVARAAAAAGRSGIAVLVGGSSTGKTRACWEALGLLRGQPEAWRLWHPIDPTRADAALAELPRIGPRTVVWLNEAQLYLDVAEAGLGERVAAGLRELLRDPARAPVLVLATLWPAFWDTLTARPDGGGDPSGADPHAQARELLAGHDITVPAAFTPAQVAGLAGAGDVRLALAARSAAGGQVVQFLAGAPELLARYRHAPPAARALISAAMDARRLGMGPGLPRAFLAAAAPGYLADDQWDALGEDWLERALAYAAVPCKGARGPLTRIRPRPARPGAGGRAGQPPAGTGGGPGYRLADYLDQHGRAQRSSQIPPAGFWAAAAARAAAADQAGLGDAAHARGLYRDAVQLHKNAAAAGNHRAVLSLADPPDCLRADDRPAYWAAAHAALDDPGAVAWLLGGLRAAGAHEQAAALLARDPAAHAALDDPGAVAWLLGRLRAAGAHEQAAALLARDPAAHAALDDPGAVASLLDSLREAGADDQVAGLLARDPAAHAALDNPYGVAALLGSLREAGAHDQAAALASRAAAHAALDGVAALLGSLREAGAHDHAAALADRAAARLADLDDPGTVASLLDSLRETGAHDQAAALAEHAAAHAALDNPWGVAFLLGSLREAGADDQAAALLAREPAAHAALDNPYGVAALLGSLREAGAHDQAAALASRAAHAALDDPGGVAALLGSLREAGAHDQAAALTDRLPAAGLFGLFLKQQGHADQFRFGRQADGSPAAPWGWEDLD